MITQLVSRSAAHSGDGGSPTGSRLGMPLSPQPKFVDPASPAAPGAHSASSSSLSASPLNLPPLAVLHALAEGTSLPAPRNLTAPPAWFPGSPAAVVSGCSRILQAAEYHLALHRQHMAGLYGGGSFANGSGSDRRGSLSGGGAGATAPTLQQAQQQHQQLQSQMCLTDGLWSWIVHAFRETEKELFDVNAALLSGMCCAANVLSHASAAGPQKFAAGITKILDTAAPVPVGGGADSAATQKSVLGAFMGVGTAASADMSGGEAALSSSVSSVASGVLNSTSGGGGGGGSAAAGGCGIRDSWAPVELQFLHLRRSCTYSPSSLLAVHGRRRDAIVSATLLAVTSLRAVASAAAASPNYFNAATAKASVFEPKIKVSFLEAIAGLAMRLAGLALTTCNHIVSSVADRVAGKAVVGSPSNASDPCAGADDPLGVFSPLPLLQLVNHCLLFMGTMPLQPSVADQLRRLAASPTFPQVMALPGLADETQKLLASTFFFFVRSTPLSQPLAALDPLVHAFRAVELTLKGFKSKAEVVRALTRLDQRRNFGRLVELLGRSGHAACAELADTFGFLKSLPKGELVLRHLPAPLSVVAVDAGALPGVVTATASTAALHASTPPALFTALTDQQLAWVARCAVAHIFHRIDSHADFPRPCSSVLAASIDAAVVLLGRKRKRAVCLKRSALMAPWRVLLPSVESAAPPGECRRPYPAAVWVPSEVSDFADEFAWQMHE